jgi:hypothetical protein
MFVLTPTLLYGTLWATGRCSKSTVRLCHESGELCVPLVLDSEPDALKRPYPIVRDRRVSDLVPVGETRRDAPLYRTILTIRNRNREIDRFGAFRGKDVNHKFSSVVPEGEMPRECYRESSGVNHFYPDTQFVIAHLFCTIPIQINPLIKVGLHQHRLSFGCAQKPDRYGYVSESYAEHTPISDRRALVPFLIGLFLFWDGCLLNYLNWRWLDDDCNRWRGYLGFCLTATMIGTDLILMLFVASAASGT